MPFAFPAIIVVLLGFGCARGGALPEEGHQRDDGSDDVDAGGTSTDVTDAAVMIDSMDAAVRDASAIPMDARVDAMSINATDGGDTVRDASVVDASTVDAGAPAFDAALCAELETRACETMCSNQGTETCSGGMFGACVPPVESCNRVDDDCDMQIDEGVQVQIFDPVPIAELRSAHSRCDGPYASLVNCMSAAKRWCARHALACFNGGAGHLQATETGARVACFGSRAVERMTTFGELSAASGFSISERNAGTRLAQSAANRYCRSLSYEAGMGPVEFSNPNVWVTCLPSELAAQTTIALSKLLGRGCNPDANAGTLGCQSAADLECRELGYRGGYGPVEWNNEISMIVCFR
jgi:hypothetical protein